MEQMETGKGFAPHSVNEGPKDRWRWHKVQKEAVGSGGDSTVSLLIRQWPSITEGKLPRPPALLEFTGK